MHVSLHGDYRYDSLKNLPLELQSQDQTLRDALKRRAEDYPLIVMGYSGRDESVMQVLTEAYERQSNGPIFWCDIENAPGPRARSFLRESARHGDTSAYIAGARFDDLLSRLALFCLEGGLLAEAKQLLPAPLKPRPPVLEAINFASYASVNLAAVFIGRAARERCPLPSTVLREIATLPSLVQKAGDSAYANVCRELNLASESVDDIPNREVLRQLVARMEAALYQATKGILRKVNKLALTALRLAAARKLQTVNEAILLDATSEALL